MLPPSNLYPEGEPYLTGRYVSRYKCHRCGKPREMPVARYNALPTLTLEDFRQLAKRPGWAPVGDLPTQDLEGTGLKRAEAEDCFVAGFWPEDLYYIQRPDPPVLHGLTQERNELKALEHLKRLGLR